MASFTFRISNMNAWIEQALMKPTMPKIALNRINDVLCGMKIAERFYTR